MENVLWKHLRDIFNLKSEKVEGVFAALFTALILLGKSYAVENSWSGFFGTGEQFFRALCVAVGLWLVIYVALRAILFLIEYRNNDYAKTEALTNRETNLYKSQWLPYFIFIVISWLPYLFVYFPGSVPHDGMYQLSMWFGYDPMSNHHPWLISALFGVLMGIGRQWSDNAGVFLIVFVQALTCAWIYGYLCARIRQYAGRTAGLMSALFFALLPVWGMYAATVIKDTWFAAVFALYTCSFIDVFQSNIVQQANALTCKNLGMGRFLLLNILVCVTRNDGIYRVIPALVVLLLCINTHRKQLLKTLILIFAFVAAYQILLFQVLGVQQGTPKEMLSVPFQQTARYVRDYGDDVTPEEKAGIENLWEYESLKERYNEELADPVKNKTYVCDLQGFLKYMKAWVTMGLRHPDAYIQATINNTYGYFYPFRNSDVMRAYQDYIKGSPVNKGFDIHYVMGDSLRNCLTEYAGAWRTIPGVSLLSNPGTYTWIVLIVLMLFLRYKKHQELAVLSIPALHIVICMLSPVNGLLRYAMPLMACTPLLVAWSFNVLCRKEDETV